MLKMTFNEELATRNTVRFQETPPRGTEARIGTIYIQNTALTELGNPDRIVAWLGADLHDAAEADPEDCLRVQMAALKPTKTTVLFQEINVGSSGSRISRLYIRKHTLETLGNPDKIRLWIKADDE